MSDSPRLITSLDDLFADSMEKANATRKHNERVLRAAPTPKKVLVSEKYALPENWVAGRAIALLHAETHTLLGNFREYAHKTERSARKLLRVDEPVLTSHIEYVSGPQWLAEEKKELFEPQSWTTKRTLLLSDLLLHIFNVHAEGVEVVVFLQYGGIGRVELAAHTTFHSPDAGTVLTLPAETNVYEVMDLDAKVQLRKELQA